MACDKSEAVHLVAPGNDVAPGNNVESRNCAATDGETTPGKIVIEREINDDPAPRCISKYVNSDGTVVYRVDTASQTDSPGDDWWAEDFDSDSESGRPESGRSDSEGGGDANEGGERGGATGGGEEERVTDEEEGAREEPSDKLKYAGVAREPMLMDPNLPAGWSRKVSQRTEGKSAGKYYVRIYSPEGRVFRYKYQLKSYLKKVHSDLIADDFDFSIAGRPLKSRGGGGGGDDDDDDDSRVRDQSTRENPARVKAAGKTESKYTRLQRDVVVTAATAMKCAGSPEPMFSDANLPEGWTRKLTQRKNGKSAGKYDVIIHSPEGKRFRSRFELQAYFDEIKSDLVANSFDFTVTGRGNPATPQVAPGKKASSSEEGSDAAAAAAAATPQSGKLLVKMKFSVPEGRKRNASDEEGSASKKAKSKNNGRASADDD
ncbi:PREDICTED: uncharacterized protein LOC106816983 isoform X2 [Priapulus caudatus]|nr:PREDICTED: uncharacterized protein LOC106816983 isoform X2 [Priapulus caudatus]